MSQLFLSRKSVWRSKNDGWSQVLDSRIVAVTLTLLALCCAVTLVSLSTGRMAFSPAQVLDVLLGGGTARARMVVLEWRLPRSVAALMIGGLLGLGGALLQSVSRNPLGSPDIVGFDAGAFTGALLAISLGVAGWMGLAVSSVAGGLVAGVAVYLLAWRGGVSGFQLIVIGIALGAMLTALNQWILLRLPLGAAVAAGSWAMGSLARVAGDQAVFAMVAGIPLLVAAFALSRRMRILEMGDERASALGIGIEMLRLLLVTLAILATAVSTSIAGPIPFIALAAPQIASALTRSAGTTLIGSVATGAFLLLLADYLAQRLIAPEQIPVGLVTLCIGGGYFLWLLLKEARR
ncbi:FecCD family ABC transporter permease [Agrobacterium rosae]|uniref:Iron chelate uptake ABC transporter family permease subunit n=1 Tax=Agrobacterium rosae TaxID=1972867 RepID=A0AAW9FND4_9HYPH|nr:iron chelate uptake ABC transporter family permease subunit [Agrobacterium rosae]MDX8304435.1 iron chelate uptake ABC transporter family permease subunit [Agrobacterium rosae]